MSDTKNLCALFDAAPEAELSQKQKEACKKASDFFSSLTYEKGDNVFSCLAEGKRKTFSEIMKISIPGENICNTVEEIRKCLINGEDVKKVLELYISTVEDTFSYLAYYKVSEKMDTDSIVQSLLAFYESYAVRCFTINEDLYLRVKNGEASCYRPFFEEYLEKLRNNFQDLFTISSFGAERNTSLCYRKSVYRFIEFLVSYLLVEIFITEMAVDSFEVFSKELSVEIINDSESFYQLWYKTNNEVIDKNYAGEEFSDYLFDMFNTYSHLVSDTKQVYEKNLTDVPVAKESDMRDLYKTIFNLKKELEQVKKELAEIKNA